MSQQGALLTGPEIQAMRRLGHLRIDPYDDTQLNPNSYNVRLHEDLFIYDFRQLRSDEQVLDMKADNPVIKLRIPSYGLIMKPGCLYLGRTIEYTATDFPLVPMLEGRSSVGRLGLNIHITAGFGDIGFRGTWTLEMSCLHPLRIYAGVEIAQIFYLRTYGEKPRSYQGKYQDEVSPLPSKLYQEF